ncbi:GNAT family N-acetyltransferase [Evansella sp. AB-P1]|uniref:GNAT family N-acetyltransferase n=1 Tax=Evansella sp. AB-P1 TaxID=3037653 RepID=UPI00241E06ED|nr:GNAT family N-acetyltransferase [Evansella sp. AB-P1]MDG5786338.1 GNAT family N-acetyltransferase [Evansella sp. AB-P1]
MDIRLRAYTSPTIVLKKIEKPLMEKEAENNLPLGLLRRLKVEEEKNVHYKDGQQPIIVLGEKEGEAVPFVMVQTPPYNLVICGNEEFVDVAVQWLHKRKISIPGVVGCRPLVDKFAEAWGRKSGKQVKQYMRQRIYQLEELNQVSMRKGRLCYATEDDLALVTYWTQKFYEESLEPIDMEQAELFVKNEIKRNTIFLWRTESCTPVSMAKRARESENGVVVSLVYTPDEYKKQGYATTCVAALSKRLLQEGFKFCSLYTDLDNPISNSIYMKIGYKPVADSMEYRFE